MEWEISNAINLFRYSKACIKLEEAHPGESNKTCGDLFLPLAVGDSLAQPP
jgi:hypothetical protein